MFGFWCCSVGLVWLFVFMTAFSPAWSVFVDGKSNFPRTEWSCLAKNELTAHNNLKVPNAPKRVVTDPFTVGTIETQRSPFFGEEKPDCNLDGWREKIEKSNNERIESAKKNGVRVTFRIVSEPKESKYPEVRRSSNVILDTEKPIKKDYFYAILWPFVVLLFGIPLGLAASWIWRKLFGSDSDLVWIRKK